MISGGVGDAFGADAHHHHGGAVSVNPMNPVETTGAIDLSYARGAIAPHLGAAIAVPLSDGGVTRAIAGGGVAWRAGGWLVRGDLSLGIAGNPFHARIAFAIARHL